MSRKNLNRFVSFENFIVTPGNRFAHAASESVAVAPGKAYNPLFIHGPTGMGKTFLLQAIGQQIDLEESPLWEVHYTTADEFRNEYLHALRKNLTPGFLEKLNTVDVLLLDDLDLLSNADQIQEILMTVIDSLLANGKQIVFASSIPPKQLSGFQDRLKSRFTRGLVVDLEFSDEGEFIEAYNSRMPIPLEPGKLEGIKQQYVQHYGEIVLAFRQIIAEEQLIGGDPFNEDPFDNIPSDQIWEQTLTLIKKEISKPSFETWFKSIFGSVEGNTLKLTVPTEFAKDWLESRYETLISETIQSFTGKTYDIEYYYYGIEPVRHPDYAGRLEKVTTDKDITEHPETNTLLKKLLEEQKKTNELLSKLVERSH